MVGLGCDPVSQSPGIIVKDKLDFESVSTIMKTNKIKKR